MSASIRSIKIGSVYYMKFDGIGSEQTGWRPGVVFQNNMANEFSPNLIALPCTTSLKKLSMPTHVLLKSDDCGLRRNSVVLCENPQRMSKEKLGSFITRLPDKYMKQIAIASIIASSAISFIPIEDVYAMWAKANRCNKLGSGGLYV